MVIINIEILSAKSENALKFFTICAIRLILEYKIQFCKIGFMANVSKIMWKTWSKIQQKNQNSKEKMQMETRIEKTNLETLGAVERERERENTLLIVM